ncbi:hypothetical protein BDV23DRAFT_179268 [Aspergillus alliaceus]|uniref:Uncharacterized protein n=1 Tax=Petromyces alliaceus TaxID=209559 RepID=A0A5N7CKX3_PETAA|nr:hypothetical protein BDV23DRAFT_179268 [Aspergillus alliaceus]
MDNLPSLVLHNICSLIWEDSPRTIHILSQVNSTCYHAAVPFIYSQLSLQLTTSQRLRSTVDELVSHPLRQQYLTFARRLDLEGQIFRQPIDSDEEKKLLELEANYWDEFATRKTDICSASELEPAYNELFRNDGSEELRYYESKTSPSWSPLETLVTKFQHLVELNYSCINPFPPALLQALHQYHPLCKLNLNSFRFRSLNDPELDPYERDIICSPCLHGITIRHVSTKGGSLGDYNEEAAREIVRLAPNLRRIRLERCTHFITEHRDVREPGEGHWNGFVPPIQPAKGMQKGNLTCLTIAGVKVGMNEDMLEKWSKATDFSNLQSLTMNYVFSPGTFFKAMEIGAFKSLQKLAIRLGVPCTTEDERLPTEIFFESLPPLKTLRLWGVMNMPLLQTVLKRHGPSLQELKVHPRKVMLNLFNVIDSMSLTSSEISQIGESCPLVEQLDLIITRSRGNRSETACYEALGRFRSLKQVSISLYYSMEPLKRLEDFDEPLDDYDKMAYNRACGNRSDVHVQGSEVEQGPQVDICTVHVRDAFINAAIDAKLSRDIWNTIISCQPSAATLQRLIVHPHILCVDGTSYAVAHKVTHMAQRIRVDWKGIGNELDMTEIGREIRERSDAQQRKYEAEMLGRWGQLKGARLVDKTIMSRIWPELCDNQDWRDSWCSLPLDRSA